MSSINGELRAVLLLPSLSLPLSPASLRTAYKSTFESLLPTLTDPNSQHHVRRLDVAIVLSPSYLLRPPARRSAMFPAVQKLLEEMYTVICIAAAQCKVDLDYPGGLDVRIILLEARTDELPDDVAGKQPLAGPLIDFITFILASTFTRGDWNFFTVESEVGIQTWQKFAQTWQALRGAAPSVRHLPCGPSMTTTTSPSTTSDPPQSSSTEHKSIAVGGTFDHLHIGHKLLLSAIVFLASPSPTSAPRTITVGITGDELLVNKKHASVLESWSTRQSRTAAFIDSILAFLPTASPQRTETETNDPGPNGHVVKVAYGDSITINYVQISDPFGPTITDEEITALVISRETRKGGAAVNDKRREKGWKDLEVFEVDVLDAEGEESVGEGFESKISSTEIRRRLAEKKEGEMGNRLE